MTIGFVINAMKEFFNKQDLQSDQISKVPISCASCGLYKDIKSPKLKPYGKFKKKILLISDKPERTDDRRGKPFQGIYGTQIKRILKKQGIDLFRDCLCTNTVNCYTKKIKAHNIACCQRKVINTIKEHKPKLIILFGADALNSVIGKYWKKGLGELTRWRGFQIPDRNFKAWICPVFHPSFVTQREEKDGSNLAKVIWKQDIKNALTKLNEKIQFEDESKYITYIESDKHFKSILPRLHAADLMSFDYEGTGLKPHAKGHKITNISACIGEKECYSWMNNKYRAVLFKKVLENPNVKKTAHNLSFENLWSYVILKAVVKNWHWCSMNTAHILDNRKGISGLKFQTYINFGVSDYDSLISEYLKSPKDLGANAFNKIEQFFKEYGEKEALKYCGLDSIFGYKLTMKQMEMIN